MIENCRKIFYLFLSTFWINISVLIGQEIKFEVYMKDPCTDSISKLMFFNLKKGDVDYYPETNNGIVLLKEMGKYELTTIYSEESILYELNDFNAIIDTIWTPKIRLCQEPTSNPEFVGYCCCQRKCNNAQIDYYSNGNKRLEGTFKDGKPLGKLKFYYSDGSLKQVDKFNKKGVLIRRKKYGNCKD